MRVPDCSMDLLVAVVATGESKTKAEAAGMLKITISAFDKRLRAASSLYGVSLIEQNGDLLRLTEAGKVFYSSAARSVELASLAEENTRTHLLLKTQHVLVGHSSYVAPALLAMVLRLKLDRYPRVQIDHRPSLTASIARSVREGEMLAGFGFLPLIAPEMVIRKVWDEPLMVCIPSQLSIAKQSVIRPDELHQQAFIAVSRDPMPGMHEEMADHFISMGVTLKVVADAFAPMEALNLVEQQVGICILSQSSAVQHRGVTVRPLWTRALRRYSAFFYREDNRSPVLDELSSTVLDHAKGLERANHPAGTKAG